MPLTYPKPTVKQVAVGLLLVAINLGAAFACLGRNREIRSNRGEGTRTNYAQYSVYSDGSLWKSRLDTVTNSRSAPSMLQPPTFPGLIGVWWPLAASLGVSLAATTGVALGLRARRVGQVPSSAITPGPDSPGLSPPSTGRPGP